MSSFSPKCLLLTQTVSLVALSVEPPVGKRYHIHNLTLSDVTASYSGSNWTPVNIYIRAILSGYTCILFQFNIPMNYSSSFTFPGGGISVTYPDKLTFTLTGAPGTSSFYYTVAVDGSEETI